MHSVVSKRNVLVVFKRSAFDLAYSQQNTHMISLIEKNDPSVSKLIEAHAEHLNSLSLVEEALQEHPDKVNYRMVHRAGEKSFKDTDLVITVGGDGTFLWASKFVGGRDNPAMIGVNSAPGSSVGYYTACDAKAFKGQVLEDILKSPRQDFGDICQHLTRLRVSINGTTLKYFDRVLNDVLFTAEHPADMTRYVFKTDEGQEEQKSSGIWFSTPSGSTAAMLSAGGIVQPWNDDRVQYKVREPYKSILQWSNQIQRLTHGFIDAAGTGASITCKMRRGLVCPDGSTGSVAVTYGDKIDINVSGSRRLKILGK